MFGSLAPEQYYPIYILVISLLTIGHFVRLFPMGTDKLLYTNKGSWLAITIALLLTLFIGLRPVSGRYFGDMAAYAWMFRLYEDGLEDPNSSSDPLFTVIIRTFARLFTMDMFFLFMEILYIVPILLACLRLSKENNYTLVLFAFAAMSFFSYGTNGIRNGAATSLFLLALTYVNGKPRDKIVFLILSVLAFTMHSSIAIPFLAVVGAYFIRNPKLMFYFWGGALLLSVFAGGSISAAFSALGIEDKLSAYLGSQGNVEDHIAKTGFRWDFLLYSSMPIVLGLWVIFKKKIYTRNYALLLGTYIYANAFWVMVIRAPYSNRFAYLSWFLYPIVLAYPMLVMPVWKKSPGMKVGIIMIGHLVFTLLIWFKDTYLRG